MYFYPTVDYRSLVGVVISIPLSNKVIFLACLYGFLSCSSSHLPLGSVSFKNNCIELRKIKRSVNCTHGAACDSFPDGGRFLV